MEKSAENRNCIDCIAAGCHYRDREQEENDRRNNKRKTGNGGINMKEGNGEGQSSCSFFDWFKRREKCRELSRSWFRFTKIDSPDVPERTKCRGRECLYPRFGTIRSGVTLKLITFQSCVIVVITGQVVCRPLYACVYAFVVTVVWFRVTGRYWTGHPYKYDARVHRARQPVDAVSMHSLEPRLSGYPNTNSIRCSSSGDWPTNIGICTRPRYNPGRRMNWQSEN